jgi:hypothetical protein
MKSQFFPETSIAMAFLSVLLLAGCGGGGGGSLSSSTPDPPAGSTSTSSSAQDSLLTGTYAFAVADKGCNCRFSAAGSFHADGSGNITSGLIDMNNENVVQTAVPVTGTYNVGTDHRGTATLQSANASLIFRFVVVNANRAFMIGFDTHQNASGVMELQDSSAFSNSSLAGAFTFRLFGIDAFGEPVQIGGIVIADGNGGISSGIADTNDNALVSTELPVQSGSLSVGTTNGRGTAAITTPNGTTDLAFYVVDANHLKLIGTDTAPVLMGDAYREGSAQVLNGAFAFTSFGLSSAQPNPFAAGGVFVGDGNGNITSGFMDTNINGTVNRNIALTGSYALQGNGRGVLTLHTATTVASFAMYPSMSGIQLVEIDSNQVGGGMAFAQQGPAFSTASLSGNFVFSAAGFAGDNSDALAVFSLDGKGNLSGTADLNSVGSPQPGLPLTGTYSFSGNSGAAVLTTPASTANIALYPVSTSQVLTLSLDSNTVMVGSIEQQ